MTLKWSDTEIVSLLEGIGVVEITKAGSQFRLTDEFKLALYDNCVEIISNFGDKLILVQHLPKTEKETVLKLSYHILGWWMRNTNQDLNIPEEELVIMARTLGTMMLGKGVVPK